MTKKKKPTQDAMGEDRQTDKYRERQKDKKTKRQKDRKKERKRQTGRQAGSGCPQRERVYYRCGGLLTYHPTATVWEPINKYSDEAWML